MACDAARTTGSAAGASSTPPSQHHLLARNRSRCTHRWGCSRRTEQPSSRKRFSTRAGSATSGSSAAGAGSLPAAVQIYTHQRDQHEYGCASGRHTHLPPPQAEGQWSNFCRGRAADSCSEGWHRALSCPVPSQHSAAAHLEFSALGLVATRQLQTGAALGSGPPERPLLTSVSAGASLQVLVAALQVYHAPLIAACSGQHNMAAVAWAASAAKVHCLSPP